MPANILVVDDSPVICAVVTRLLEREDYTVQSVQSGGAALTLLHTELPDLILLDVTMPDIDGLEVCRQLKQQPRTSAIPVILLTGLDDMEYSRRGAEVGANDVLTKPFNQQQLLARVHAFIS